MKHARRLQPKTREGERAQKIRDFRAGLSAPNLFAAGFTMGAGMIAQVMAIERETMRFQMAVRDAESKMKTQAFEILKLKADKMSVWDRVLQGENENERSYPHRKNR